MIPKIPPLKPRTVFYGALVAGHIVFTMTFPYVSGSVANWLNRRNLMDFFIASFSVPFFTAVLFYAYKKWSLIQPKRRILLASVILLYCAAYFTLSYPPEKLHILNFSFMGIIFYKFLSPLMKVKHAAIRSLLYIFFIGTLDEFLQKWIPARGASVHDVILCYESATLGVMIAWIFDKYSRKGRS